MSPGTFLGGPDYVAAWIDDYFVARKDVPDAVQGTRSISRSRRR